MKYALYVAASILLLGACKSKPSLLHQYANTNALPMQQFTISTAADTTLTGSQGIKVFIAKGTFTGAATVTVLLKEALDYASILKAGLLTTTTDGKALSSGGMFYLGTVEKAAINMPIQVSVPTKFADPAMQLYRGKEGEEGIGWEEPRAIDSSMANIAMGKALFDANCASCHKIDKQLTAPALAGVGAKKSREWLYRFTSNPALVMAHDEYAQNLKKQMGGSMMTAFPGLSLQELNTLYNYIDAASKKLGYSVAYNGKEGYFDTCCYYKHLYEDMLYTPDALQQKNSGMVAVNRNNNNISATSLSINQLILDDRKRIQELRRDADYYNIKISAEGWYNIDRLIKEDEELKASILKVKIEGDFTDRIQVFLAIPSYKVLINGGLLDDGKLIGFDETNGSIHLPQNDKALIYAIGENKGEFYFTKIWFNTQLSQIINLAPIKMDKQNFERELANLGLEDVKASVTDSKNAGAMKGIDSVLKKMEGAWSGDCDCEDDRRVDIRPVAAK